MFLRIETDSVIYETQFRYFQVEITGKCNMACVHCRASVQPGMDMDARLFRKVLGFGAKYLASNGEVVVSGGEPFVHKQWRSMFSMLVDEGIRRISITSNGLLFSDEHAEFLARLPMENMILAFSLDSKNPDTHNAFRRNRNAYKGVVNALDIAKRHGLKAAIRATVWNVDEIDGIVELAAEHGCGMVGLSDVHRFGEALNHPYLFMDRDQKWSFHQKMIQLGQGSICVNTNDPLFLQEERSRLSRGGCGAGVFTFNVNVDGTMTPCAFLPQVITVVSRDSSLKKIKEAFSSSEVVKGMLEMRYRGKCGSCQAKSQCGGCRSRAFAYSGDYLGEDPHCYY